VTEVKPLPVKLQGEARERAALDMMDAIISGRDISFEHKFIGFGRASKRYGVKVPQTAVHRYQPGA
jgi:hypothetical protein